MTQEKAIKNTSGKTFVVPLNIDFFKRPVYSYPLKEDLTVSRSLNSTEKVTLFSRDNVVMFVMLSIEWKVLQFHRK